MRKLILILLSVVLLSSCVEKNTNPDDNIDMIESTKTTTKQSDSDQFKEDFKEVGRELREAVEEVKAEFNKNRTDFSNTEGVITKIYHYTYGNTMPREYVLDKRPEIHNNGWVSFWCDGEKRWIRSDNIVILEIPVEK